MSPPTIVYVAVHGGAGYHGRASEARVKAAMKRACTEALRAPSAGALAIVETAIAVLEDDDSLNAGHGSNLTFERTVECDAAIMDARTQDFGSVGAVSGVQNPIRLARAVLEHARVPDRLGRIPPLTLVADGARAFAERAGVDTVDPARMIVPRAVQDWQRWMARYHDHNDDDDDDAHDRGADDSDLGALGAPRLDPDPASGARRAGAGAEPVATVRVRDVGEDATMQDTVGAIAWDAEGNLAAGVSSGGLLLKYSGRLGEAAMFGAGCWAEQSRDGSAGMACSISGAGEHIVRTDLARTLADALRPPTREAQEGQERTEGEEVDVHDALTRTLAAHFYDPIVARGEVHHNAGVLLMTKESRASGDVVPRLWCAFTADSMAVAHARSDTLPPKAKILRRPTALSQSGIVTNTSPVYITALPLFG